MEKIYSQLIFWNKLKLITLLDGTTKMRFLKCGGAGVNHGIYNKKLSQWSKIILKFDCFIFIIWSHLKNIYIYITTKLIIAWFTSKRVKMLGLMLGTGSLQACRVSSNMARWLSTSHPALTKIIYTETDEAPMLATYSLLPVIQRFAKPLGIEVSSEFGGISSTPWD